MLDWGGGGGNRWQGGRVRNAFLFMRKLKITFPGSGVRIGLVGGGDA